MRSFDVPSSDIVPFDLPFPDIVPNIPVVEPEVLPLVSVAPAGG
jgi:hypothetical protein